MMACEDLSASTESNPQIRLCVILLAHLAALGLIHGMLAHYARQPSGKALPVLRHFYPVLLYAGFFAETGWLNQMFVQGYLDAVVIRWDGTLFGCQPSLVFMQKLPFLAISEIFYAAYFSYYLMIGGAVRAKSPAVFSLYLSHLVRILLLLFDLHFRAGDWSTGFLSDDL